MVLKVLNVIKKFKILLLISIIGVATLCFLLSGCSRTVKHSMDVKCHCPQDHKKSSPITIPEIMLSGNL